MRHLIDPKDLSVEETGDILALAERIRDNMPAYSEAAKGKKIATLFYEPSTRTRLSFETAMLNLGGTVIGFPSAANFLCAVTFLLSEGFTPLFLNLKSNLIWCHRTFP